MASLVIYLKNIFRAFLRCIFKINVPFLFLSLSDVNGETEVLPKETEQPCDSKVLNIKTQTASLLCNVIHYC